MNSCAAIVCCFQVGQDGGSGCSGGVRSWRLHGDRRAPRPSNPSGGGAHRAGQHHTTGHHPRRHHSRTHHPDDACAGTDCCSNDGSCSNNRPPGHDRAGNDDHTPTNYHVPGNDDHTPADNHRRTHHCSSNDGSSNDGSSNDGSSNDRPPERHQCPAVRADLAVEHPDGNGHDLVRRPPPAHDADRGERRLLPALVGQH